MEKTVVVLGYVEISKVKNLIALEMTLHNSGDTVGAYTIRQFLQACYPDWVVLEREMGK